MKSLLLVFILALNFTSSYAQTDSIHSEKPGRKQFLKQQVVPLSLVLTGSLLNIGTIKNRIEDAIPETNIGLDDYLQYSPMAQMYLYDALGFKHQNSVFDQTKYLVITQLISGIVVQGLKSATKVSRPTGANNSFPSGHTTFAFAGATVLYHEFIDTDPWLAYSGYFVATATGCLRMTNRAHWLPDVLTGAGIGILTGNLVYYLKPLKKLQFSSGSKKISFSTALGYQSFSLACHF
ncbi:MAG: phosphatase PAP2 family protein [Bacteroidota bacterium]|nr:phosphatase PAP2 family protein [Bacteroidota bacterium]